MDDATQLVSAGFTVGADTVFDDTKPKDLDLDPRRRRTVEDTIDEEAEAEDSGPRRYHVVADGRCVVNIVGHEMLQTLVPTAQREVLDAIGKFRLAVLAQRSERRRMLAAQNNAKLAEEDAKLAEEVSFKWKNPDFLSRNPDFLSRNPDFLLKNVEFTIKQNAKDGRTRDAWIAAQRRAVALRTTSSSHGASPQMLLNTEAAMREMQRAERRSFALQLSEAVGGAWMAVAVDGAALLRSHAAAAAGGRAKGVEAAVQAVGVAVSTVQKLQSVVASLKEELIEYRMLLRNAGRFEVRLYTAFVLLLCCFCTAFVLLLY